MKKNKIICFALLCFLFFSALQTGFSETVIKEPFSPKNAVEGAEVVKIMHKDEAADFKHILKEISNTFISNGSIVIFPFMNEKNELCYNTLDLSTLNISSNMALDTFKNGEKLLRVLPQEEDFFVLTNQALYQYDNNLRLANTLPLPDALKKIEGWEEKLCKSGEVNQEGTLLLFEDEKWGQGIYLCDLKEDATPALLLPGITYADTKNNPLEGYQEGRFAGANYISAYLCNKDERIIYEIFDLEGRRLYQSYVFNQQLESIIDVSRTSEWIWCHEDENREGLLHVHPTSLNTMPSSFYYLDYQTLKLDKFPSDSLYDAHLQFCELDGRAAVFAIERVGFPKGNPSDIHFFKKAFSTQEEEQLPFVLSNVSEFTGALAPGGRILFMCRDSISGVYYSGVFCLP